MWLVYSVGNSDVDPPDSRWMNVWMGGRGRHNSTILIRYQCSGGNEAVRMNRGSPQRVYMVEIPDDGLTNNGTICWAEKTTTLRIDIVSIYWQEVLGCWAWRYQT